MATVLPYIQKDVFGGPAGSTQQAMQQLITGILQGAARRRAGEQQQLVQDKYSQFTQENPNANPNDFVNQLFQMDVDPNIKNNFMGMMQAASGMDLQNAQAENLRTPKTQAPKMVTLEWWHPTGEKPGGKRLVPEDKYNDMAEQLEEAGYVVREPKATATGKDQAKEIWAKHPEHGWEPVYINPSNYKEETKNLRKDGYTQFRKSPPDENGASANEAISQLKLDAWKAYLSGKATQEQAAMIGTDKDPYIGYAAQAVQNDINSLMLPLEDKIKLVLETAELYRAADTTKNKEKQPTLPALPPGFKLD